MNTQMQPPTQRIVGVDAHSETLVVCILRRNPDGNALRAKVVRTLSCSLDSLETTFAKFTTREDEIVLEATTNAFSIVSRLRAIGRRAFVVASGTIKGFEQKDKITDKTDAAMLARIWHTGLARQVWVPDKKTAQLRDIFFGYRNATKDRVRASNRIWGFCSEHGFPLPKRSRKRKVAEVRAQVDALGWDADERFHVERLLVSYERACEDREVYRRKIDEIVAADKDMLKMMQVLGVSAITAFALKAFIGEVKRFGDPKKLVSYFGLNPSVCGSGKYEAPRRTSCFGVRDVKALLIECAQSALRTGKGHVHTWARRLKIFKGEKRAVVALARKMVTYLWHALMGHPCPSATPPQGLEQKLVKLSSRLGRSRLSSLGFKNGKSWVNAVLASQNFVLTPPSLPQKNE